MKPQNFPLKTSLDGSEEVYTQTNGVSEKFTLEQTKDFIRPYKVYSALLSQSGTRVPSIGILENTLEEVIWTYDKTGSYKIDAKFIPDNTLIFLGAPNNSNVDFVAFIDDKNSINLLTYESGVLKDGLLLYTSIEIRVYL